MKKKALIIAVSILAVVAIVLLVAMPKKKIQTGYETTAVFNGKIENSVTATGTVEPIIKVEVGTQVSGIIDHIYVDFNSKVKKGQVLAALDRTNLEAELKSSEASLQSSETEYKYQKKNFERSKSLFEKKLISDTEYESAKYTYDKACSAYSKACSDIKKVKQNLAYATIYSPIDGVVLDRAVDEGQTVAASFSTPTLFTIANDLTRMQVIANVDEADIGEVADGQKVTFTVDAFPDDVFNGSVIQVRLQPTTTSNVVTYEVVVNAPNPDYKLKPGLTANITITTMEKDNVLLVPVKAFRFNPEVAVSNKNSSGAAPSGRIPQNGGQRPQSGNVAQSGVSDNMQRNAQQETQKIAQGEAKDTQTVSATKTLWIKNADGKLKSVNVTVGATDGIYTEVTGDIKAGDLVVTGISTTAVTSSTKSSDTGSSPFMPTRPGQKKK